MKAQTKEQVVQGDRCSQNINPVTSCPCLKPLVSSSKPYLCLQSPKLLGSSFLSSLTASHSSPSTSCSGHFHLLPDLLSSQAFSHLRPCVGAVPSVWTALCLQSLPGDSPPGRGPIAGCPSAHRTDDCAALSVGSRKLEPDLLCSPPPSPAHECRVTE